MIAAETPIAPVLRDRGVLLLAENVRAGGINRYVTLLAGSLRARGVPVAVAAIWPADDQWLVAACAEAGVPLHVLARRLAIGESWRIARRLGRLGRCFGVIHTQGHYSGVFARLVRPGPPLVATVHALGLKGGKRGLGLWYAADWQSQFLNQTTIANSAFTAHGLEAMRVPRRRVVALPLGIVAPPPATPPNANRIVFVGRLSAEKGTSTLIAALRLLIDGGVAADLTIVGDGPERAALEAAAEGLPVTFAGAVADPGPYYANADIVAVPSIHDSFGLTAVEAQARGVPVVASAVEGLPEVIAHGDTGLLVPPADPAALAAAIRRLLNDPAERARIGAAGRSAALMRNSIDRMADETIAIYNSAVASSQWTKDSVTGLRSQQTRDGWSSKRRQGRPRLLFLAHVHYPQEVRVRREVEALASFGYRIDVVSLASEGAPWRERSGALTVYRLPLPKSRRGIGPYLVEYGSFIAGAFALSCALSLRHRYQAVIVYSQPDLLAFAATPARLGGARLIFDLRDLMPEGLQEKFGVTSGHPAVRVARGLEDLALSSADAILTVHDPLRRQLEDRGYHDVGVYMNLPDPTLFRRPAEVQRPEHGPIRLMHHGSLNEVYNVRIILHALDRLRTLGVPATFTVYGDGPDRPNLEALSRELGLDNVTFAGRIPVEEMAARIAAEADVGIVPTRSGPVGNYSLSNKLLEYVALGVPVIASRLPNYEAIFSDASMIFFDSTDIDALADAIVRLTADRALGPRLAANADADLSRFSWAENQRAFLTFVARHALWRKR